MDPSLKVEPILFIITLINDHEDVVSDALNLLRQAGQHARTYKLKFSA